MTSILAAVAAHANDKMTKDKPAVIDTKRTVTYGDFWQMIQAFAETLKGAGISRGDTVMISCTQDAAYLTAIFACQLVGAVPVPLEKGAAQSRIDTIYADAQATLFIGKKKPELPESVSFMTFQSVLNASVDQSTDKRFTLPKAQDTAEILFSTGTTGKPKGIVLTQANDVAIAENVISGVAMQEDNVEIIPMPLSHSHGLRRTYANLYNGSTAVLIDGVLRVKLFFDMIEKHHVTAMDLSPAILTMLFKLSKDKLADYKDQIAYVQLGSAPLTEEAKTRLTADMPDSHLYNFYGTTEAGCSCILDFSDGVPRESCIGRPAKNARFFFTNESRHEVAATREHPGLIATAGSQNMAGYLNAPELTAQAMHDGVLYTNDLGYKDADGYIYCLGRQGDVINCGGIKIAPDEIETEVAPYPALADCAVVPAPDKIQGQVPKLFVSLKNPEKDFDMAAFKKYLKAHLDSNKVPKQVVVIDKIPRTSNGKVQRKKLMSPPKQAAAPKPAAKRTRRARG